MNRKFITKLESVFSKLVPLKPEVFIKQYTHEKMIFFHVNHVLEPKCSNFDAYGYLIFITPITILSPPFNGLSNRNKFDFTDLDVS